MKTTTMSDDDSQATVRPDTKDKNSKETSSIEMGDDNSQADTEDEDSDDASSIEMSDTSSQADVSADTNPENDSIIPTPYTPVTFSHRYPCDDCLEYMRMAAPKSKGYKKLKVTSELNKLDANPGSEAAPGVPLSKEEIYRRNRVSERIGKLIDSSRLMGALTIDHGKLQERVKMITKHIEELVSPQVSHPTCQDKRKTEHETVEKPKILEATTSSFVIDVSKIEAFVSPNVRPLPQNTLYNDLIVHVLGRQRISGVQATFLRIRPSFTTS